MRSALAVVCGLLCASFVTDAHAQALEQLDAPQLSWEESPPLLGLRNPEIGTSPDEPLVFGGLAFFLGSYALSSAFMAPEALRACNGLSACNDWARPFGFIPFAHWVVGFNAQGDIGAPAFIIGGAMSGLELIAFVTMLSGLLHHHPAIRPSRGGVTVTFD